MTSFKLRILAQALPFLLVAPGMALAQMPPTRGEATAALHQANPAASQYSRQQIDQMVAPIALYPDQLLAQVMMAATFPQQVMEASEWLKDPRNVEVKGDALVAALQPLPWDPSVKALVAFPQIVAMMTDHIEWTQTLGVAFATQQAAVMTRVQLLRQLAFKTGRLKMFQHLAVRQEGPVIVIEPAERGHLFVPVYNPIVVYGEWPDRDFPPVFISPPSDFVAETIEPGIEFSAALEVVGPLWGWSRWDWRADRLTIDRTEFTRISRDAPVPANNVWVHSGPVVLAVTGARQGAATANVPSGTVAPAAAAAVTSLPQRAAADPARIQAQGQTGTSQPGTARPGQAQTTTGQPSTATPGEARTGTSRPSTTQPGQAETTTGQPGAEKQGQARGGTSRPGAQQPGQAESMTSQPGATKQGRVERTLPSARGEGSASEPGKPGARTPSEGAGELAPPRTRNERGETMTPEPGKAPTTAARPQERRPEQTRSDPVEQRTPPGMGAGSPTAPSHEPGLPPSAARPAERTIQPAPNEAREPGARGPEHAAPRAAEPPTRPAAQAPGKAPEGLGHGTSEPPAAAAPSAGQPREQRPAGRDAGGPKER
jgi:hypothetical protein